MQPTSSYRDTDAKRKVLIRGLSHDYKRVLSSIIARINDIVLSDDQMESSTRLLTICKSHLRDTSELLDAVTDDIDDHPEMAAATIVNTYRRSMFLSIDKHIEVATFAENTATHDVLRAKIGAIVSQSLRARKQISTLIDAPFDSRSIRPRSINIQSEVVRIYSDLYGVLVSRDARDATFINRTRTTIVVDQLLLTIGISNLITNAIVHGKTDHGLIIVVDEKLVPMTNGQPGIEIGVQDNGSGVSAGDEAKIFKLFERGASAADSEGNGLGLPFARLAAEMMGGTLVLDQRASPGARFVLTVPLVATAN